MIGTGVNIPMLGIHNKFLTLGSSTEKRARYEHDIGLCTQIYAPKTPIVLKYFVVVVKGLFHKLEAVDDFIEKRMGRKGKGDREASNLELDRGVVKTWISNTDAQVDKSETLDAMIKRWEEDGLEASKIEAANWIDSMESDYLKLYKLIGLHQTDFYWNNVGRVQFLEKRVRAPLYKVCKLFRLPVSRMERGFEGGYVSGRGDVLRSKHFM
jgi:hypothetical protein